MKSSFLREKDSAAMDKILSDVHLSLPLESILFDFSASMIERAVRLVDKTINFNDLAPTVLNLIARNPYEFQKRWDQSS